jgi:hypothetical protein
VAAECDDRNNLWLTISSPVFLSRGFLVVRMARFGGDSPFSEEALAQEETSTHKYEPTAEGRQALGLEEGSTYDAEEDSANLAN